MVVLGGWRGAPPALRSRASSASARRIRCILTTDGPSRGIPGSFLEPLGRSWSHFIGIYRHHGHYRLPFHEPGAYKEQLRHRNVQRFRGGLVFKAHRLVYHSTLGRVIKKKKEKALCGGILGVALGNRGCFWSHPSTFGPGFLKNLRKLTFKIPPRRALRGPCCRAKGEHLDRLKDFILKAKARNWP